MLVFPFLALSIGGIPSAGADVIDLLATETASPRVNLGGVDANADNRLRAYNRSSTEIDGFIKFDFSSIPDLATVTSITLTLYSEGAFGVPHNSPEIQIRRSSVDAWVRGGSGFPPEAHLVCG